MSHNFPADIVCIFKFAEKGNKKDEEFPSFQNVAMVTKQCG